MRNVWPVVAGVVGGLIGGLLVQLPSLQSAARAPARAPREADPELEMRIAEEATSRVLAHMEQVLAARLREIEEAQARAPSPARPGRVEGTPPAEEAEAAPSISVQEMVDGLRGKPFGPDEGNRLFGWLSRNPHKIDATIEQLKKEVERDPRNPDLQVALATAYVGKIVALPDGPQRGMVWGQAVQAYDAALEVAPTHWYGRYGKAFGTSMIPGFLGQRPVAIRQFEELIQLQEGQPAQPHHVQTYFRLGSLYKEEGNTSKALEVWRRGLQYFPDNATLRDAIDVATTR